MKSVNASISLGPKMALTPEYNTRIFNYGYIIIVPHYHYILTVLEKKLIIIII